MAEHAPVPGSSPKAHPLAPADVRLQLSRILPSRSFQDAGLLKRFLSYSVEHTLAGEADQLKEYRLGVEVFGRKTSFDPRLDPVVRIAARRLRIKLKQYYGHEGALDPILIEIPKGGYSAAFSAIPVAVPFQLMSEGAAKAGVPPSSEVEQMASRATRANHGWKWTLTAAAVLVGAALVAGGFYYRFRQASRLTDKDTIVIADFANGTGDPVFDDTLKTALVISLRQSPYLNVLSDQKVAATLQTMVLPADVKLTSNVARELCQRAGCKAYIAGAIASLGSEYVLG